MRRSCASGRPPSGVFVPAAQVQDRDHRRTERPRAVQVHDIGLQHGATRPAKSASKSSSAAGLGRTPMIGRKVRDFLPEEDLLAYLRSDPARLQPLRPPGQQVQGADQDPRARDRPGRS
jgi:hypothetical protein